MTTERGAIFVGNSFPFSLVRRPMGAVPVTLEDAQRLLFGREFFSFWGHTNSLGAASQFIGYDLTPRRNRPALGLDKDGFLVLEGVSAREVLLLTPEYPEGFRPEIGQEVAASKIVGFRPILLSFR